MAYSCDKMLDFNKRNVLAISYMLPPLNFPQSTQVDRLLSNSRHFIGAVSGHLGRDYGECIFSKKYGTKLSISNKQNTLANLHRLGLKLLPFYGSQPDEYRTWALKSTETILKSQWLDLLSPEIVVSFGEPMSDHLIALEIKKKLNIKWLAHFSDPWAFNPFRRIHKLSHSINKNLENTVLENADMLIFTSEETKLLYANVYGNKIARKSAVINHSFDPALYRNQITETKKGNRIRYIGNFYGNRTPIPFIKAVNLLHSTNKEILNNIKVEFIGGMPKWMQYLPEIYFANKDIFHFEGSITYEQSIKKMEESDLLVIIDAPSRQSVFFPSKLADYIGTDKAILGITPPGAASRIINFVGGKVCDPKDINQISHTLMDLIKEDFRIDIAQRKTAAQNYSIKRNSNIFDSIICNI